MLLPMQYKCSAIAGNRNFKAPDGTFVGIQKMASTLHWGPRPDANRFWLTSLPKLVKDLNANFTVSSRQTKS